MSTEHWATTQNFEGGVFSKLCHGATRHWPAIVTAYGIIVTAMILRTQSSTFPTSHLGASAEVNGRLYSMLTKFQWISLSLQMD